MPRLGPASPDPAPEWVRVDRLGPVDTCCAHQRRSRIHRFRRQGPTCADQHTIDVVGIRLWGDDKLGVASIGTQQMQRSVPAAPRTQSMHIESSRSDGLGKGLLGFLHGFPQRPPCRQQARGATATHAPIEDTASEGRPLSQIQQAAPLAIVLPDCLRTT